MIQLAPPLRTYPRRLLALRHPPDPLWVWGTLPDERLRTVGIVGTRRCTPYGMRIANEIALALARSGAVIVSGLAQGIDSSSHLGALEAGGLTVAVLGEGLAYFDDHGPHRRRELARRIRHAGGALVSEYALDVTGQKWTYPQRNATLAALSDVVVVIEAPEGSGALITAAEARSLGRPVFAVPGPLGAPTWNGSHVWIAEGKATLLHSARQITDTLGLVLGAPTPARRNTAAQKLLALLAGEPADADAIAEGLELCSADATTLIAEQLIAGTVVTLPDGRFARR